MWTRLADNPLSRDVPYGTGEIRGWREEVLKKPIKSIANGMSLSMSFQPSATKVVLT
jgi:hypothetical protein